MRIIRNFWDSHFRGGYSTRKTKLLQTYLDLALSGRRITDWQVRQGSQSRIRGLASPNTLRAQLCKETRVEEALEEQRRFYPLNPKADDAVNIAFQEIRSQFTDILGKTFDDPTLDMLTLNQLQNRLKNEISKVKKQNSNLQRAVSNDYQTLTPVNKLLAKLLSAQELVNDIVALANKVTPNNPKQKLIRYTTKNIRTSIDAYKELQTMIQKNKQLYSQEVDIPGILQDVFLALTEYSERLVSPQAPQDDYLIAEALANSLSLMSPQTLQSIRTELPNDIIKNHNSLIEDARQADRQRVQLTQELASLVPLLNLDDPEQMAFMEYALMCLEKLQNFDYGNNSGVEKYIEALYDRISKEGEAGSFMLDSLESAAQQVQTETIRAIATVSSCHDLLLAAAALHMPKNLIPVTYHSSNGLSENDVGIEEIVFRDVRSVLLALIDENPLWMSNVLVESNIDALPIMTELQQMCSVGLNWQMIESINILDLERFLERYSIFKDRISQESPGSPISRGTRQLVRINGTLEDEEEEFSEQNQSVKPLSVDYKILSYLMASQNISQEKAKTLPYSVKNGQVLIVNSNDFQQLITKWTDQDITPMNPTLSPNELRAYLESLSDKLTAEEFDEWIKGQLQIIGQEKRDLFFRNLNNSDHYRRQREETIKVKDSYNFIKDLPDIALECLCVSSPALGSYLGGLPNIKEINLQFNKYLKSLLPDSKEQFLTKLSNLTVNRNPQTYTANFRYGLTPDQLKLLGLDLSKSSDLQYLEGLGMTNGVIPIVLDPESTQELFTLLTTKDTYPDLQNSVKKIIAQKLAGPLQRLLGDMLLKLVKSNSNGDKYTIRDSSKLLQMFIDSHPFQAESLRQHTFEQEGSIIILPKTNLKDNTPWKLRLPCSLAGIATNTMQRIHPHYYMGQDFWKLLDIFKQLLISAPDPETESKIIKLIQVMEEYIATASTGESFQWPPRNWATRPLLNIADLPGDFSREEKKAIMDSQSTFQPSLGMFLTQQLRDWQNSFTNISPGGLTWQRSSTPQDPQSQQPVAQHLEEDPQPLTPVAIPTTPMRIPEETKPLRTIIPESQSDFPIDPQTKKVLDITEKIAKLGNPQLKLSDLWNMPQQTFKDTIEQVVGTLGLPVEERYVMASMPVYAMKWIKGGDPNKSFPGNLQLVKDFQSISDRVFPSSSTQSPQLTDNLLSLSQIDSLIEEQAQNLSGQVGLRLSKLPTIETPLSQLPQVALSSRRLAKYERQGGFGSSPQSSLSIPTQTPTAIESNLKNMLPIVESEAPINIHSSESTY